MSDSRRDPDEAPEPASGATPEGAPEATGDDVPRLEVATVAVLLASVVLGLVPPTEQVAPLAWLAGMVMVLLSRRWGAGDKALALLAYGILGVPFVVLGRDELRAPASIVTGVVLVALWVASAAWLLRRARSGHVEGRGLRMR